MSRLDSSQNYKVLKTIATDWPTSNRSLVYVPEEDGESDGQFLRFTYRRMSTYTIDGCAYYCLLDVKCKSFNYLSLENTCEINLAARDLATVEDEGWIDHNGIWIKIYRGLKRVIGSEYRNRRCYKAHDDWHILDRSPCMAEDCNDNTESCSMVPFLPQSPDSYTCISDETPKLDVMPTWSAWDTWTECPVTCGASFQQRTRECDDDQVPWFCSEHKEEKRVCATNPCPIWSHWGSWSECSTATSCGKGSQTRVRSCLNGGTPNQDDLCQGDINESEDCYVPSCKTDILLSNKSEGAVRVYEDTVKGNADWKYICEDNIADHSSVAVTVCHQLSLGLPDATQPVAESGEFTTFLFVTSCDVGASNLMECEHVWAENKLCSKLLHVKCSDATLECYNTADNGRSYAGFISTTEDGNTCQDWASQVPQSHSLTPENYPAAGLVSNYCRNPDNEDRPWCYTTNPNVRWRYCKILPCPEPPPWSPWSSWGLCSNYGNQTRLRKRIVSDELEFEEDMRKCLRKPGMSIPGWFDGNGLMQYIFLTGPYSSIHTARMDCVKLGADILTDESVVIPPNKIPDYGEDVWIGIIRSCDVLNTCSWSNFNGEGVSDTAWISPDTKDTGYQCARMVDGKLLSSPCEYKEDSNIGVICQKSGDMTLQFHAEVNRLVMFDELSFSLQQLRASHWTTQNSNVLCRQFKQVPSKENRFIWRNTIVLPIALVAYNSKSSLSNDDRCTELGGSVERMTLADFTAASADLSENNFDTMAFLNFKHCLDGTQTGSDSCAELHNNGELHFCLFQGACKNQLGQNAVATSSTSLSKQGATEAFMNWAGLNTKRSLRTCDGWQPTENDDEPYVQFEFTGVYEVTGIQMFRSWTSPENVDLTISYSLDGDTWFKTKSRTIHFGINDNRDTLLFDNPSRIISSYLRIQSFKLIEHSCLKLEIFGCKIDPDFEYDCADPLNIRDSAKSHPPTDSDVVKNYRKNIYYSTSKDLKAFWIPSSQPQPDSCDMSDFLKNHQACPWWELKLAGSSYVSEIAMQGLTLPNQRQCAVLTFIVAYVNSDISNEFKLYSPKSSYHPKIFYNVNGIAFTKHVLTGISARKIRIFALQWHNMPCAAAVLHGCSLKQLIKRFYGMGPSRKSVPQKSLVMNYDCRGNESNIDDCPFERIYALKSESSTIRLNCKEKYFLEGSVDETKGYVKWWNEDDSATYPLEKSLRANDSKSIFHWNLANSWNEDREEMTCNIMDMQYRLAESYHEIPSAEFATVSAKTSMGYRDKLSGKLVTGFPWNIYQSGESTAGNTWCPLRYGEFITFELKRSYLINKLIITLHRGNEKGKMHEKFSAKMLDYFVQFSTEKDSWTNVPYKGDERYSSNLQWTSKFANNLIAKRVRIVLTKHPIGYECFTVKLHGKPVQHTWELESSPVEALGMQDGRIIDDQLKASSIFSDKFASKYGRLGDGINPSKNTGWACRCFEESGGEMWIQVEVNYDMIVRGIITQGAKDGDYYVKSFKIAYSDCCDTWKFLEDDSGVDLIFDGNRNGLTKIVNYFPASLFTKYVRIYPWTYHNYVVLRFELIGNWARDPTVSPTATCPDDGCFPKSDDIKSYRGTLCTTNSGLTCQKWASQSPHKPNMTPEKYPNSDLVENYCRTPIGSRPWCYTMSPSVRFEYCDVRRCDMAFLLDTGKSVSIDGVEFWLINGEDLTGVAAENDRKLCKLGGGDLAHKIFEMPNGGSILRSVALNYTEYLDSSTYLFFGTGLTSNLAPRVYQFKNKDLTLFIEWTQGEPNNELTERYVGMTSLGASDMEVDYTPIWLCEKLHESAGAPSDDAICAFGYTLIGKFCYKVVKTASFQTCREMFDYCQKEGSVGIDLDISADKHAISRMFTILGQTNYKVCNTEGFSDCRDNTWNTVQCVNPMLYAICKQAQEYPSLLSSNEFDQKVLSEQYTSSSYTESSPPWLVPQGQCSSLCFDDSDHERWVQIDLTETRLIYSVSSYRPTDACNSDPTPAIEDINDKIDSRALRINLVTITDFQGLTRDGDCVFHTFSDGSWRCQFSQPLLGRFVKIIFEKSSTDSCVTIDVKGENPQIKEPVYSKRFLQMSVDNEKYTQVESLQVDNAELCAWECIKRKRTDTCRVYTFDTGNCKLYSLKKSSEITSTPFIWADYLLEIVHNVKKYTKGLGQTSIRRKIPGSLIAGCFRDNVFSDGSLIHHSPLLPWECTEKCFSLGYEDAILKSIGYCYCGLVDALPLEVISNFDDHCAVPCAGDHSTRCGGLGYSLVYRKPVRCYRGHLLRSGGSHLCLHVTKKDFQSADRSCTSRIAGEDVFNPITSKEAFDFTKTWSLKLEFYAHPIGTCVKSMKIWCGRLREFSAIPPWVQWATNHPVSNPDSCVVLVLMMEPGKRLISAVLETVSCDIENNFYICDLGTCDGNGICERSEYAQESHRSVEFVSAKEDFTWYEGREYCIQQNKDLCHSSEICQNATVVFATQETNISSPSNIWVPIRDTLKDWMYLQSEGVYRCQSAWSRTKTESLSDVPQDNGATRRLFCCGKYTGSRPIPSLLPDINPGKKRHGPIQIVSQKDFGIYMHWIGDSGTSCCSDCFVATPVKMPSHIVTEFYYKDHNLDVTEVSLEMVDAPGYFLTYCDQGPDTVIVAQHYATGSSYSFHLQADVKNCYKYAIADNPLLFVKITEDQVVATTPDSNDDEFCLRTSYGLQFFDVSPKLQSWQYSRDFCDQNGMRLCESTEMCRGNLLNDAFYPNRDFYNSWLTVDNSTDGARECNQSFPRFGLLQGKCTPYGDLQDNLCTVRGSLPCCDSAYYVEDNNEEPYDDITLTLSPGLALEYGYLSELDQYDGSLDGSGSGQSIDEISVVNEKECFQIMSYSGYFGYAYSDDESQCTGIDQERFQNLRSELSLTENQRPIKLVRIADFDSDNVSHIAYFIKDSVVAENVTFDMNSNFTFSVWFMDHNSKGGILVSYVDSGKLIFSIEVIIATNTILVFHCGQEYLYHSYAFDLAHHVRSWHNIVIVHHHNAAFMMYLDGARLYNDRGDEFQYNCEGTSGMLILLPHITIADSDPGKYIIFIDMWSFPLQERVVRNQFSKTAIFGDVVSSKFVGIRNHEYQTIIPSWLKHLNFWSRYNDLTFTLSAQTSSRKCEDLVISGDSNGPHRFLALNRSDYITPCTLSEIQYLEETCSYSKSFQISLILGRCHFSLQRQNDMFREFHLYYVNLGNGSYGITNDSTTNTLVMFPEPDIKFTNNEPPTGNEMSIPSKNDQISMQLNAYPCWVSEDIPGDSTYRRHHTHVTRSCLRREWKAVGCVVPLFQYGSFFDYLAEKWRRPGVSGGIGLSHIIELFQYAKYKAKNSDIKYYRVCFGGYTVRLLRMTRRLNTIPSILPTESVRSGLLQYYDDHFGWGIVCANQILNENFAKVACTQLGYAGLEKIVLVSVSDAYRITMKNPVCFGNEAFLDDCRQDPAKDCDQTRAVHITCKAEWRDCSDGFTRLTTGVCVSAKVNANTKIKAEVKCENRGGALPEPWGSSLRELLPVEMELQNIDSVWMGTQIYKGTLRWSSTGDEVSRTHLPIPNYQHCVSFDKDMKLNTRSCSSADVGTLCVEHVNCPGEFSGTQCELVNCTEQDFEDLQYFCSSEHVNALHVHCTYQCPSGTILVGHDTRQCVMSKDFGPVWSGVQPLCGANSLSAIQVCEAKNVCNNGACVAVSGTEYRCECQEGFGGPNCKKRSGYHKSMPMLQINPCKYRGCLNHGTCIYANREMSCVCRPGYHGERCENFKRTLCESNPCLNAGTCIQTGSSSIVCRCPLGYAGSYCEHLKDFVGPAVCTFPFFLYGQKHYGCISVGIDKYVSMGCWEGSHRLFHEIQTAPAYSETEFRDECFQVNYENGYEGFGMAVENGNFLCFEGRDIMKKYSVYGESDQCQYKNSTENVEIFKIKHESIGIKWCSTDKKYSGKHALCQESDNVRLQLYNSAEQPTVATRQCYQRQSSPYDSNIFNDLKTHVNEILSCAHSGQAEIRTAVIRQGTLNELTFSEETCHFLSQRDTLLHYGCFDDPDSRNMTSCYGKSGNQSFCLVNHTEVLMPCESEAGHPGYARTTLIGGTAPGGVCKFPFDYVGETIETCKLGWCYTDDDKRWTYCIQETCQPYPNPLTSALQEQGRPTSVRATKNCAAFSDHQYLGRGLAHKQCELACSSHQLCLGYLFLPEFDIFLVNETVYSLHTQPTQRDKAARYCASLDSALFEVDNTYDYEKIATQMASYGMADHVYWLKKDDDCAVVSFNEDPNDPADWSRTVKCDSFHPFLCQRDADSFLIESLSLGKAPSTLGYCIGVRNFKQLRDMQPATVGQSTSRVWWGWKKQCEDEPVLTGQWTDWFNTNSVDAFGDLELLNNYYSYPGMCRYPLDVDVRDRSTHSAILHDNPDVFMHKHVGAGCLSTLSSNCADYEVRFLCQFPESLAVEPITGRRWDISQAAANWTDAQNDCKSKGGKLAVVDSRQIERYLKNLAKEEGHSGELYIGLKSDLTQWIDGSYVQYHNLDEPLLYDSDDCVVVKSDMDSVWETADCALAKQFICEFPIDPAWRSKSRFVETEEKQVMPLQNNSAVLKTVRPGDVDYCLEMCDKTPICSGVLVEQDVECLLLTSTDGLVFSRTQTGQYKGMFKLYQDGVMAYNLDSLGPTPIEISIAQGFKRTSSTYVHSSKSDKHCILMSRYTDTMTISFDFTTVFKIYLLNVVYQYQYNHDEYGMATGVNSVKISHRVDTASPWQTEIFEDIVNGKLVKSYDVPILARYVNVSTVQILHPFQNEIVCVQLRPLVIPVTDEELSKYPHGYLPPPGYEDAITASCEN